MNSKSSIPESDAFFTTQAAHVRQCLKEARIAVCLWLIGFVWSATVIITMGYIPVDERPAEPELLFGIPSWVVWGLFVPWFAQIAAAWWFALFCLKDDEPYLEFPD